MMSEKPLYGEVKQFIVSWVNKLGRDKPTKAEEEELKNVILNLGIDSEKSGKRAKRAKRTKDNNDTDTNSTNDNRPEDSATKTGEPTTLMELVQYVLGSFNDERLKELKVMVATLNSAPIFFESRVQFQEALMDVHNDHIHSVFLGGTFYGGNTLKDAYIDINGILCTTYALVQRINRVAWIRPSLDETVFPWNESFVEPTDKDDLRHVAFCPDFSKASALVVSGESGSGKTWFAQQYIPYKLGTQDMAVIYCSIQENDGHAMIKSDDSLKTYKMACGLGMRHLVEAGRMDSDVYHCLRDLSMEYNKGRNTLAYNWLQTKIGDVLSKDQVVNGWWTSGHHDSKFKPIEKLVLVVDEVGKNPDLARGLVSTVRKLYRDIKLGKAKQVLLVLVGSGLDRQIRYDSVPDFESEVTQAPIASFGTDPSTSNFIILKGPDLNFIKKQKDLHGIPTKSILRGTYSRTLATNTRMLTRGVLPMMKIPQLSEHVPADKKAARYEALGSANIVMYIAAMNYVALGGLSRIKVDSEEMQRIVLTQFKLLLHASLATIKESNPASAWILKGLNIKMPNDLDEISALGLVTADVKSTSGALRYLACNGSTAPLDARDGIGFEIMLQVHLVRLCESLSHSRQVRGTCWVGHCILSQACPPFTNKGDDDLSDNTVVMKEVEQGYKRCNDNDVSPIMSFVEGKGNDDFDLVIRQTVSHAQGADLMILSRRNGKVVLHLYQCKNWKKIPGTTSKEFLESFWSLGVKIDEGGNVDLKPSCGSAGYSFYGIKHFAEKLREKLGTEVEIGDRILVVSATGGRGFREDFLLAAEKEGVMVWTREMLEPTISALYTRPASE